MKKTIVLLLGLALAAGTVNAEDAEDAEIKAASLDELLQMVKAVSYTHLTLPTKA